MILVQEPDVPFDSSWVEIILPRDKVVVTHAQKGSTSFPLNCRTSLDTKNVIIIHI